MEFLSLLWSLLIALTPLFWLAIIIFQQISIRSLSIKVSAQSQVISRQTEILGVQNENINIVQNNVKTVVRALEKITGVSVVTPEPQSDDWADVIEGEIIE